MSLEAIMTKLGHTYIDVLKIDIEGSEFHFFRREVQLLHLVGQLVVEVHNYNKRSVVEWDPPHKLFEAVRNVENNGMRLFFKEVNKRWPRGAELSFIQADWSRWDKHKAGLSDGLRNERGVPWRDDPSSISGGNGQTFARTLLMIASILLVFYVSCLIISYLTKTFWLVCSKSCSSDTSIE
jgi:hypothetical protein